MAKKEYTYRITDEVKKGSKENLFNTIAHSIYDFLKENKLIMHKELKCAFIFGFPVKRENIESGKLVKWTKGFQIHGAEDYDPKKLLRDAIARKGGMNINIVAFINQSTSLLYSGIRKNPKCKVGLIFGTEINASYMENVKEVFSLST